MLKYVMALTFAGIFIFTNTQSNAEITLSWTPNDTTIIAPTDTTRLSITLNDTINFRTIEITATYDTTLITSLGGDSGSLFSESSYFLFEGFEETPGTWHGYAIVMGAEDYLTGPGELLHWDFVGLAPGTTPIIAVETHLFDEASPPNIIPNVSLNNATVTVQSSLSSAQAVPNIPNSLQIYPNPFNPKTQINFEITHATQARLSVFDIKGHLISILHEGPASPGSFIKHWDGTDDQGRAQPTGLYLFQLQTSYETARAKGFLVK